jgi:hypothetical protein
MCCLPKVSLLQSVVHFLDNRFLICVINGVNGWHIKNTGVSVALPIEVHHYKENCSSASFLHVALFWTYISATPSI